MSSGVVDLINKEEFLNKLKRNRPLRVKAGFDPSKPDIHLGHAVLINKLREFQELGHEVFFVVGDFTACVGDPSGQNKTRPVLSFEEAKKNAESYVEQATKRIEKQESLKPAKNPSDVEQAAKRTERQELKVYLSEEARPLSLFFKRLDIKKTKCVFNSQWLDKIPLRDFVISVSSKFTLARQLERNDFALRYKSGKAIGLHELFYPILQAYDSMELKSDVEIGGTDQLFNLLLGRDLQERFGQSPQAVMTLPLLEGLDGSQKMSKSLNNAISFNDKPRDIYGKVMKISDDLLIRWWSVFTKGKWDLKKIFQEKGSNPMKKKEELALILVASLYGEKRACQAQEEFSRVISNKGLPDQILEEQDPPREKIGVCELVKRVGLCASNSEARRGILSGAVRRGTEEALGEAGSKPSSRATGRGVREAPGKKSPAIMRSEEVGGAPPEESEESSPVKWEKWTDPKADIDLNKEENQEFILSFGKRKFKRVNLKWKKRHELKAYLAYRKWSVRFSHFTGEDSKEAYAERDKLCKELAEDEDFTKAGISLSSIKMKFQNNRFLDTRKGLQNCSNQNKEIFDEYRERSIEEIEKKLEESG